MPLSKKSKKLKKKIIKKAEDSSCDSSEEENEDELIKDDYTEDKVIQLVIEGKIFFLNPKVLRTILTTNNLSDGGNRDILVKRIVQNFASEKQLQKKLLDFNIHNISIKALSYINELYEILHVGLFAELIDSLEKRLYIDMFDKNCFSTYISNNTIKKLYEDNLIKKLSNEQIESLLDIRDLKKGDTKDESIKLLKEFVDKY